LNDYWKNDFDIGATEIVSPSTNKAKDTYRGVSTPVHEEDSGGLSPSQLPTSPHIGPESPKPLSPHAVPTTPTKANKTTIPRGFFMALCVVYVGE